MVRLSIELRIPDWINDEITRSGSIFDTVEKRMELVIKLAGLNVEKRTGGPFGAAIFDSESGELISAGVNHVVESGCSIAHAEMLAISLAQKKLGSYDLGASGMPLCELVTSTAPCAMCLGAIPWSGVKRVICGARDEDARKIGFDEGAKVNNWVEELNKRGIVVATDVLRENARAVLEQYFKAGGEIYNSRAG